MATEYCTEQELLERRAQLAAYVDRRVLVQGRFRLHKLVEMKQKIIQTALFEELEVKGPADNGVHKGTFEIGHCWVQYTNDMHSADIALREGDVVEFTAAVRPYKKMLKNIPKGQQVAFVESYNLEWPKNIVLKYRATYMGMNKPVVATAQPVKVEKVEDDEPMPEDTETRYGQKAEIIKNAIQKTGNDLGRQPTAKEVQDFIAKHYPGVSVSNVYINLTMRAIAKAAADALKREPVAQIPTQRPVELPQKEYAKPLPVGFEDRKKKEETAVHQNGTHLALCAKEPAPATPTEPAKAPDKPMDYLEMVRMVKALAKTLGGKERLKEFVEEIC